MKKLLILLLLIPSFIQAQNNYNILYDYCMNDQNFYYFTKDEYGVKTGNKKFCNCYVPKYLSEILPYQNQYMDLGTTMSSSKMNKKGIKALKKVIKSCG
tara:strand:- start:891 stop:1187 length:297 start_codon:yes stop_codon:yes gene_type:complete